MNRIRKYTKRFLITVGIILLLLTVLYWSVYIPFVQRMIVDKIESAASEALDAEVNVGGFGLSFFADLELYNVEVVKEQDTLMNLHSLSADIEFKPLLDHRVVVDDLQVDSLFARVYDLIPDDSTQTEEDKVSDAQAWEIVLNNTIIRDSKLILYDPADKMDLQIDIGLLQVTELTMDSFVYSSDYVRFENTYISYVSPYIPDLPIDTTPTCFTFSARAADLINSEFFYNDTLMTFKTGGQRLRADSFFLDVAAEEVKFSNIAVDESYFNLIFINDTVDTVDGGYDWKVWSERVAMQNSEFTFDVAYLPEHKDEFDYNHIHFYDMDGSGRNLFWSFEQFEINLDQMAMDQNHRVRLLSSSGKAYVDREVARINNLKLKTDKSDIALDMEVGYDFYEFEFLLDRPMDIKMQLSAEDWGDLEYFGGSDLTGMDNYGQIRNKSLETDLHITGTEDSLHTVIAAIYNRTAKVNATGYLRGMSGEEMSYDYQFANLQMRKKDVALFEPDTAVLAYLPERMRFHGRLSGNIRRTKLKGQFVSDYGTQQLDVASSFDEDNISVEALIQGNLDYADIRVEQIKLNTGFRGSGLSDMQLKSEVELIGMHHNGNRYDSATTRLSLDSGDFKLLVNSFDHKAMFALDAGGNLTDSSISLVSNIKIDSFAMKRSGLFESPEVLRMNAILGLNMNFNTLNADFGAALTDIYLIDSSGTNFVERVNLAADHSDEETHLNAVSDHNTIKLDIYGNLDSLQYNFEKFVDILMLDQPRSMRDSLHFPRIELLVDIQKPYELLGNKLSSELPHFSRFYMEGNFDNTDNSLGVTMFMPDLVVDGNVFDSTAVEISGNREHLDFTLHSNMYIDSTVYANVNIDGLFKNRELVTHLRLSDRKEMEFIDLQLRTISEETGYKLHLMGDTLTILANHWHINPDNSFEITADDYIARNIELHRADKGIFIKSNQTTKDLFLQLDNIDLDVFNRVLDNDTMLYGQMWSKIRFNYGGADDLMDFQAKIDSLKIENYYIGDLDIRRAGLHNSFLMFDGTLHSVGGHSTITAKLGIGEEDAIDMKVRIGRLRLRFLNTLMAGYIYDVDGRISTNLDIAGTYDKPIINGFLRFHDFKFGSVDLHEVYRLNNEKVFFENNIIKPGNLKMYDGSGHEARFSGTMSLKENKLAFHKFHLKSDGFELMNSTIEENSLFYGVLVADIDIRLDGDMDNLNANSRVVLDYPTNVNYVFPEDLSVDRNEDIVIFAPIDTSYSDARAADSIRQLEEYGAISLLKFFDAELEVKSGCKFNLYFDQSMEDYVSITGHGAVSYIISNNKPKVSGVLNIDEGKLNYSMPMVSMEQLNIDEGSFIQFTDQIDNPIININASSKIWAQTGDLIEDYNKNLEVTVYVYMKGRLDNLIMQFDLSPITNDALISSKIAQMTEKERAMNAVNLLVRGQFASRQSNMTIDLASYVGGMMAKALNKLISDRIKFVDMSFDIKSFNHINSSGAVEAQSNMFFTVGKSFYHDRIRIKYQGNLSERTNDVNDPIAPTETYTQNNFTIEYDINKRGNLQAVFFVKDAYEDLLEGSITSTGGGIKMRKNYSSFYDIFHKTDLEKQQKQQKKAAREQQKEKR